MKKILLIIFLMGIGTSLSAYGEGLAGGYPSIDDGMLADFQNAEQAGKDYAAAINQQAEKSVSRAQEKARRLEQNKAKKQRELAGSKKEPRNDDD